MKNIMKIIITLMLVLMLSINFCYGVESDDYVRVRIRTPRQFNEQLEIDGYDNITVYENASGVPTELFQIGSEISVLIDSYYDKYFNYLNDNGANNALVGPYHVKLSDDRYATYAKAENRINIIEQSAGTSGFYPYYNGTDYEIYIGAYVDKSSAENVSGNLGKNGFDSEVVNGDKKNIVIYDDHNEIIFMYSNNYNIYLTSYNSYESCDMIKIDSKPYRGMMSFNIINNSTLISINLVDVESYLYGVVPCESSASWPIEALKAQTLAARTYALANLKPNAYYGYDVEDNTYDQVYGGYSSEYPSTNEAVDETKGEKIYYDGELIDAVFHSTSGGSTENSENVWANALPYLRGVEDEYSNISPLSQWEEVYSKDYIINRLKLYGNNVSDLYGIEITEISENNRVQECIFDTDIGKITYTKDKVRSVLGLKSLWFTIENNGGSDSFNFIYKDETGAVPSRGSGTDSGKEIVSDFNAKYIISSSKTSPITQDNIAFISSSGITKQNSNSSTNSSDYSFSGRGWGHGLGLSQYGAKEMATEGFTYEEIIKHYYTGVNIK